MDPSSAAGVVVFTAAFLFGHNLEEEEKCELLEALAELCVELCLWRKSQTSAGSSQRMFLDTMRPREA